VSEHRLDIAATLLLALAAIATAWATYQSSVWRGNQAQAQSASIAARVESTREAAVANRQIQVDVAIFTQWVDAFARDETELADFYRSRFRDEFEPAFAAWLATKPFTNPNAPPTPFALSAYRLAASEEADRLDLKAGADSERAKEANERANNYMLAVVLFASSVFFAGMSAKLRTRNARMVLLGIGCVLFLATVVWLATLPVELTT
jgi:hypothetical protein